MKAGKRSLLIPSGTDFELIAKALYMKRPARPIVLAISVTDINDG